jgi:hypothetical protein
MFTPSQAADLDKFFLGVKKLSESTNPSKTAVLQMTVHGAGSVVGAFFNPMTGIPYIIGTGALSKLLHSPKGVQALTRGLTVPLGNKAASAAAAAEILKLAGDEARPVLPKAAGE